MDDQYIERLRSWFLQQRRDLPWRRTPTPYQVWVSEVMLQQTQVAVVIPYYERWMARFPSVAALAAAPQAEVIKAWEGLGYYSRARNLHAGAQSIMERFGGEIPNTAEELASIKGLGPYTVGAILSFAFHQKAPAIDGNVLRVIARLFGIDTPINRSATLRQITETVDRLLPDAEPWVIMEALIELGATVCQKKARCADCPVAAACSALRSGRQAELPVRPPRAKATKLHRVVPILYHDGQYLLRRCAEGEVMQDLHEFPFFEAPERISGDCVKLWLEKHFGASAEEPHALPRIKHGFTRYQVTLFPYFLALGERHELQGFQWTPWEQIRKLAFSSGHRRVLDLLGKEGFDAHSTHGSL